MDKQHHCPGGQKARCYSGVSNQEGRENIDGQNY